MIDGTENLIAIAMEMAPVVISVILRESNNVVEIDIPLISSD